VFGQGEAVESSSLGRGSHVAEIARLEHRPIGTVGVGVLVDETHQ